MSREIIRYAITNRSQYGSTEQDHEAGLLIQTRRLAQSGIDFIQLREKDLNAQDLLRLTHKMLGIIQDTHSETRLLINSCTDVAAAGHAHGVHLTSGEGELSPAQARKVLRVEDSIISVSCHTLEDIKRARDNRTDIILFGPVFGKFMAGELIVPGKGLEALSEACLKAGDISVLALGGVTADNTAACIEAGARGIAAIRLFRQ